MAGRRTTGQEADGALTIQCEWFPDLPPAMAVPDPWRRGEENWLETEMRLFGSAMRTAFNRLAGGITGAARGKPATPSAGGTAAPTESIETTADRSAALRRGLKQGLQTAFGLNSRYADDAILKANEVSASQRAGIPVEIAETEAKRERTERKRKASQRKAERLREAGREVEAAAVEQVLRGQEVRLTKLEGKLAVYRRHQAEGTLPAVVFGGRRLWRHVGARERALGSALLARLLKGPSCSGARPRAEYATTRHPEWRVHPVLSAARAVFGRSAARGRAGPGRTSWTRPQQPGGCACQARQRGTVIA